MENNVKVETTQRVDENSTEISKQGIRERVWKHLEDNSLVLFPRPVYNRIPNFKGAAEAAQRLKDLDTFQNAKTVLVNPDKPLESARMLALEESKKLVVPVPRLQVGLLTRVQVPEGANKHVMRKAITRQGISDGQPIDLDSDLKIDLIIIGSVAVARNGLRIGKGQGYTDLEFAIIQHMKALNENALIATIVHESQVLGASDMPQTLFGPHDVPVDIIVTPTETILVSERPSRPSHIMWHLVSQRRIDNMPALKKIKESEENAGKVIVLKEVDTDLETTERSRMPRKFFSRRRSRKPIRNSESEPNEGDGDATDSRRNRRKPRRARNSENQENEVSDGNNQSNRAANKKKRPRKPRPQIEFSVKVGNIAKTDRVRDIKSALAERGVKPFDITWRGVKGFCYLHFAMKPEGEDPLGVDSIIESLSGIQVGGTDKGEGTVPEEPHVLTVEPAKPITRIETTDVTAV